MTIGGRRPTVLFDLDGTLLDTIQLIMSSARFAFEKLEREWPSDEVWLRFIGIPLRTMFRPYARDEDDCNAFIRAYREFQMANHDRLTLCYDGVADTVLAVRERGHDVGIVTSKSEFLAFRGLSLVGLARHVDTIVGLDASKRHKPDPEPVRLALHRLDCAPADAVFVGDSIHDMQAGNAAGVRTIAALWGPSNRATLEEARPTHLLSGIRDLLAVLER